MNRRDAVLVPLLLGTASAPLRGAAQVRKAGDAYRVGYLGFTASHAPAELRDWDAFVQRLRELGYNRGGNLVVEERYANEPREHYADFAAGMVKIKADVVVVSSGTMARYVMGLSRTIPIVALALADPVRSGLVASLARPGGQLTGLSDLSEELVPKQIEFLTAAVPSVKRIAYANCPFCAWSAGMSRTETRAQFAEQVVAAHALGVTLLPADLSDVTLFDDTKAVLLRERADALLIGANRINVAVRDKWLAFAALHRLPTLAPYRSFGALLSYGPDYGAIFRRAAELVANILGGASPGELPMEQPAKFAFTVNLRMAKSMGIAIPQSLLLRADEVIQWKRRELVCLGGVAMIGLGLPALAQSQRVMRLGVVGNVPAPPVPTWRLLWFFDELERLGWNPGQNIAVESRYAMNDPQRYHAFAAELLAAHVDVIYAPGDDALEAAYKTTRTIPIVTIAAAVVELGYAKSLARPGGNVTGVVYQPLDFIGKSFEILRALRPDLKKVGISHRPGHPLSDLWVSSWQTVVGSQGASTVPLPFLRNLADIEPMLAIAKREGVQALVGEGPVPVLLGSGFEKIQAWATDNRVLTYGTTWTRGEHLVSFGPDPLEIRLAAIGKIDRILRGARPADIPIEQPTKFELIINRNIARAMGLTIPQSVLLQATEVIG